MESSQPNHFIALPLINNSEDRPTLPLAINVVAKYWGEDLTEERPQGHQVGKGAVVIDGLDLAEKHGLTSYIFKGSIKDIKKRIDQGIPPIVIMPGLHDISQHATVVSGYDVEERRILTYVPEPDTVGAIPELKFEQDWEQDDMTEIIIIPAEMKKDILKDESLKFAESNRTCFESERLRQEGKTEKAIEKLLEATKADANNAQVWLQIASIYNEKGSDQAIICYERAISINPRYYMAYRGLGNYYLKKKEYSLAEECYTNAIRTSPSRYGPIYKNRAIARMQNGNNAGAKDDLTKYLEQTPNATDSESIKAAIAEI